MTIENNDATNTTDTNLNDLEKTLNDTLFESFDDGLYIGMMSGTSLDGMDAVLCQFSSNVKTDNSNDENASAPMQLLTTYSQDFPKRLREVLLALCQPNGIKGLISQDDEPDDKCGELDWFGWASRLYGEFASEVVNTLLQQADIDTESVLAIGCHGQTVRHRPQMGFSLQLVDANIIAEHTGISVISDFRRRDMAVGGQGAPWYPPFIRHYFRQRIRLEYCSTWAALPISQSCQQTLWHTLRMGTLVVKTSNKQLHKSPVMIPVLPTYY